jgi:hypothetical protein
VSPARRPESPGGFVLVGVVMMVLALTIIGLSLYGLSGYESQFFGRTLHDRQAFYAASGGIELAKSLLATPLGSPAEHRLSNVTRAIGREGIVSAVAWQDNPPDTTGVVDWSDSITIRIGVDVHGSTRTVQARYMGSTSRNPYLHLFTCPGTIWNDNPQPGLNRPTILVGRIWQTVRSSADTAWTSSLDDDTRISFVAGEAPEPDAASFLAAHGSSAVQAGISWGQGPPRTYLDMDAGSDTGVRYFYSAPDESTTSHALMSPYFDFFSQRTVIVRVRGTAIWLVPRGTQIEGEFTVQRMAGASTARLVMVVNPNGRYVYPAPFTQPGDDFRHYGPRFENGVQVADANTSLFLVSDGTVRIDRPYAGSELTAQAVSVFGHRIEFKGPEYNLPRKDMRLEYPAWLEAVATDLYVRRLLPRARVTTATGEWTLNPGSWTSSPGLQ